MCAGGYFADMRLLPWWIGWLRYTSFYYFTFGAVRDTRCVRPDRRVYCPESWVWRLLAVDSSIVCCEDLHPWIRECGGHSTLQAFAIPGVRAEAQAAHSEAAYARSEQLPAAPGTPPLVEVREKG